MLTGCFGLLCAFANRFPAIAMDIEAAVLWRMVAPWFFLREKIGFERHIRVRNVKDRGRRTGNRGHDPPPVSRNHVACFLFSFLMQDELPRRRVVIDDAYLLSGERREHRYVQFDNGPVSPERSIAVRVEPHPTGNQWQQIVTLHIAQVACADLCSHIPAIKGGCRVGNATYFQAHIGKHR